MYKCVSFYIIKQSYLCGEVDIYVINRVEIALLLLLWVDTKLLPFRC